VTIAITQSSAPATILVVDDETALLRLLARVLERVGHRVLTAADGLDAIAVFNEHRSGIDALILDVNIPPDGIHDVMLHMMGARADLALILFSGDILESPVLETMESHGGTFLRKPFAPKKLVNLVESKLRERLEQSVPGRRQQGETS